MEAAQDTAKIAIGGRRRICCPRTTTLEAGTAKTAPNDRWKRVQRPNAGRRARNHLNDRLHERGEGLVRRRGSMDARGDGCSEMMPRDEGGKVLCTNDAATLRSSAREVGLEYSAKPRKSPTGYELVARKAAHITVLCMVG